MNERERAAALARAIDEMIRGAQTPDPHDEELQSLLRVADARRQASIESGRRSADHESAVWQRLVARLDQPATHDDGGPGDPTGGDDDLRDVAEARRRVAEDVHKLAEQHREDVWQRVQERIATKKPRRKGIFSFLQSRTEGDIPVRRTGWGHTGMVLTGDADVDSLLRVALKQPTLRDAGERQLDGPQSQLKARVRTDPARQRARYVEPAPARPGIALWAGAVAAIGVLALVLGPIPFTGLSDSPAAHAAEYLAEHLGVTETRTAPPDPGNGVAVTGQEMSAADASTQLGLPLTAPADVMGYPLGSQRFYPQGITSSGAGSFAAYYVAPDGASSFILYEEAAGGDDLAVPDGAAVDIRLDGAAATYYEGAWVQAGGSLSWQADGAQTIVFERDGVRFTLKYSGPHIDPAAFITAAAAI